MSFYAVKKGRKSGIFDNWSDCKEQVNGFSGAEYKKFQTKREAEIYLSDVQKTHVLQNESLKSVNDASRAIILYIHGSCADNGRDNARAGVGVYFGNNLAKNISEPLEGIDTNNRAQIHAAIVAIKSAKAFQYTSIIIRSNSKYLCDAVKDLPSWKNNGWKRDDKSAIINLCDFEALDQELENISERVGNDDNSLKQAKKLAKKGIVARVEDNTARFPL